MPAAWNSTSGPKVQACTPTIERTIYSRALISWTTASTSVYEDTGKSPHNCAVARLMPCSFRPGGDHGTILPPHQLPEHRNMLGHRVISRRVATPPRYAPHPRPCVCAPAVALDSPVSDVGDTPQPHRGPVYAAASPGALPMSNLRSRE